MEPDFSGWATKAGLKCTDGRTITADAFKHQDKMTVPLVWQHGHDDIGNVLGHAVLQHVPDEGVRCDGYFNETTQGQTAKLAVEHGDLTKLSIWANQLMEKVIGGSKQVLHGAIREVSLALAGANPGANIDFVRIAHADGSGTEELSDEAIITMGLDIELKHTDSLGSESESDSESESGSESDDKIEHADLSEATVRDVFESLTEEQQNVVNYMIGVALEAAGTAAHSGMDDEGLSHSEIFDKMSEPQKAVVNEMVSTAVKEAEEAVTHSQEGSEMGRNVFDQNGAEAKDRPHLSHDQLTTLFTDAERLGSLKESFLAHAGDYGFDNVDLLFPEVRPDGNGVTLLSRRMEWVQNVLSKTKHIPFSRVKSTSADITADEARARGYVKGNLKKNEIIKLLRRTTTPKTIYKKQKLDRDDIVDITDLDIVAWLKAEMRVMLDEELARAVLISDGRESDDPDKIDEDCIRPVAYDVDMYNTTIVLADADLTGDKLVDLVVKNMNKYKGTGTPTMYTTSAYYTGLILSKDTLGRRLYATKAELAAALLVDDIVLVEAMERDSDLVAVVVNLADYSIGTDAGGEVNMFDNFDIDYNQMRYLIETRCSGALTRPKSALTFKRPSDTVVTPTAPTFVTSTGVLTVPAQTGTVYQNADTGVTLSSGAQTAIASGATIEVEAVPAAGYGFTHDAATDWSFTRD